MKKLSILITLFFSVICYAQNDINSNKNAQNIKNVSSSSESSEIYVDINKSIYINQNENSYFTKDEESAIKAMLIPMSFETMKINMQKKENIVDKGVVTIDGVDILFVREIKKIDSGDIIFLIYCKKNDENSSISFVSFYPKDKEDYYKPIIEKSFFSAKLKN